MIEHKTKKGLKTLVLSSCDYRVLKRAPEADLSLRTQIVRKSVSKWTRDMFQHLIVVEKHTGIEKQ